MADEFEAKLDEAIDSVIDAFGINPLAINHLRQLVLADRRSGKRKLRKLLDSAITYMDLCCEYLKKIRGLEAEIERLKAIQPQHLVGLSRQFAPVTILPSVRDIVQQARQDYSEQDDRL